MPAGWCLHDLSPEPASGRERCALIDRRRGLWTTPLWLDCVDEALAVVQAADAEGGPLYLPRHLLAPMVALVDARRQRPAGPDPGGDWRGWRSG